MPSRTSRSSSPALLPLPRDLELSGSRFILSRKTLFLHPEDAGHPAIRSRVEKLGVRQRASTQVPPCSARAGDAPEVQPPDQSQGYAFEVTPAGLRIAAADRRGLQYALETLLQLIDPEGAVPCGRVRDWPVFPIRYHHDDISRKQISTVADFKRILWQLARYKISHYTPYIEDMLQLDCLPGVSEGRGKLTPEDVKELLRESEAAGVEIFPTITLIGHHENLLRDPRYAGLATDTVQMPSTLDPRKPEVRKLVRSIIEEVCELFPSEYFHMGFDETQGVDREAFFEHANWCAEELSARGRRPLMWIDRIYGKFGMETLDELHPAIIPVIWAYRSSQVTKTHARYFAQAAGKRESWALTGYNNWKHFIPDIEDSVRTMKLWAEAVESAGGNAIGASQWGDDGYENHRDLPWNLFAAFADYAWSGSSAEVATQPQRFQRTFYGRELSAVGELITPAKYPFRLPGAQIWELHRVPPHALVRAVVEDPSLGRRAKQDLTTVERFLRGIRKERRLAVRERGHLLHWESALRRTASVLQRIVFASTRRTKSVQALDPAGRKAVRDILRELERTRAIYRESWLQNNRPENIEISLGVFDRRLAEYRALLAPRPGAPDPRFLTVDLGDAWNGVYRLDASTFPIGDAERGGIPFRFGTVKHAWGEMEAGVPLRLRFPRSAVADLKLIASVPGPQDRQPRPALRVELLRGEQVVFCEDLLAVTHVCDWHDPLRCENTWAGGGYHDVDPIRVDILDTIHRTGLTLIHRFPFVAAIEADGIRLTDPGVLERRTRLMALTVETAPR